MIIRRVRVRAFRGLGDGDFAFAPGLNVVRGRNDAGKSTLHLAFSAALFPIRPSEAKSYRPWGEGDGEVTLEFEADGRRYELRKDFASQKTLLRAGGGEWEASKDVAARVAALLGFGSLALFRATAHIGQWQLAAVQDESREIGAHLSRIMTGTDGDAVRVLRAVAEWIRRQEVGLRGRPASAPGPLKRGQDRLKMLTDERQRLAAEVKEIEGAASERELRGARINQLEVAVAEDEALLAANRRLLELDRRWDDVGRRAADLSARLERIDAAARDLAAAGRDPARRLQDIPDETLAALQQAAARADVLRQQAEQADAGATGTPAGADAPRQGPAARPAAGLWTLAGLAGAAGVAGVALLAAHHQVAGGISLAAAAAAGLGLLYLRGRAAALGRRSDLENRQRVEQARRVLERLREQAGAAADTVRRDLSALGVDSIDAAIARRTAAREARERGRAAGRLLEGLLGGQSRDAIADEHRHALTELGAVQAQREEPDLALRRLEAAAFQRRQLEAHHRRQALDQERAAVQRLEGRLAGRSPHEALARVEEELADTEGRLARQQRQVEALRLTHDVLDRAHRATIVPGRARLEELASGYLRRLSNGAYDRITVDELTLAPRVWVGPPKDWADVSAREIGSGGVDQCYLALRLGLADLLADGRQPPLFLDDPFLAYDDDRRASAMTFLRAIARGRQIFLFTCKTEYDPYADHIAVLVERRASAEPAPAAPSSTVS
ncbi:MAG TPA: AAA family ATPase [bacterium]|nr:AAA family ATPase [bacterium]